LSAFMVTLFVAPLTTVLQRSVHSDYDDKWRGTSPVNGHGL